MAGERGLPAVCGVAGCVLLLLRPLLCVFTRTELALLLAGAYGYDQWQGAVQEPANRSARRRPLTVVAVTREGKMTLLRGGDKRQELRDWRRSDDADSVATASTSASDDSQLAAIGLGLGLDAGLPLDDDRERGSESSAVVHAADGRAVFVTSSICMSRCSSAQVHSIVFNHARGRLALRQDAVFHIIRRWTDCSVHLSVLSGHLHVHRKRSKNGHLKLQLADFTGATIHRRHKADFKVRPQRT